MTLVTSLTRINVATPRSQQTVFSPPVVLLPGLFGGEWIWEKVGWELLRTGRRVVTVADSIAETSPSIADSCEGLRRQLVSHGIESAHLVGNSMGALVALVYTSCWPEQVASLTISGCPGLEEKIELDIGIPTVTKLNEAFARTLAKQLFHNDSLVTDEIIGRALKLTSNRRALVNIVRLLRDAKRHKIASLLDQACCPMLLAWGEYDRTTPSGPWKQLAGDYPNAEFALIPDSGHSPMLECPEEFNAVLLHFVESCDLAALAQMSV